MDWRRMRAVRFSSGAQPCPTLRPHGLQHARLLCPSPTLEPSQAHFHRVGDAIQPSHPLLSPFPAALNLPQHQGLFYWVSSLHQYWSFSFNISSSSEGSWLISFRIGWFDLLALQGTFRSLLQHYNLKASILWHSAFFMVQVSHPYKVIVYILWNGGPQSK